MKAISPVEIVRRSIEFSGPERLPFHFLLDVKQSDVVFVWWNFIGPGDYDLHQSYDEFGCLWVRSDNRTMGQVKGHPLADWSAWDHYQWPDPNDPAFYQGMDERFEGWEGKYVLTGIVMLLWERMWALHGFENSLADLYLEREKMEELADRIVEYDLGVIENLSRHYADRIHGLVFSEDWGTQESLMINPELWRVFFKPRYKVLFDAIHDAGWHVWMHTDGRVNDIMDDLIEVGLDVIQLMSPNVVGIEEVGERFRGRICLTGGCDVQNTLPLKDIQEVQEEARLILANWAAPDGGFIAAIDDEDARDLGMPEANVQAMVAAFREADPWKRRQ
jgi:hypothetical protein